MKICPVCSARCFDDMETCYGCLHTFADVQAREYEKAGDGEEFEKFEPEPVSDQVIQQMSKRVQDHKQTDSRAAVSCDRKHCFTAQIDISHVANGAIGVSIRVPSEVLQLFSRKCCTND